MKPHQIISLMTYPGADNTLAMADHYNHIHVGFRPLFAQSASLAGSLSSSITPSQWIKLIARLGEIPDPTVSSGPSAAAIPVHARRAVGRRQVAMATTTPPKPPTAPPPRSPPGAPGRARRAGASCARSPSARW